jgi:hypothetical protein
MAQESWFNSWKGQKNFFLQIILTGSTAHPVYSMATRGSFPRGKAVRL